MATSLTLQNDASLAQGYVKVNGTTSATFTTSGITGNLTGNVTGSLTQGGSLTLATAQTASGTAVDFTGIPSWAKRITVMLNGVSTSGSSSIRFQVGSGGVSNSGYSGSMLRLTSGQSTAGINGANLGGFDVYTHGQGATFIFQGNVVFTLVGSNTWTMTGLVGTSSAENIGFLTGASPTLAGTLDRIRITTVNGTDTFDAGTINISFEG